MSRFIMSAHTNLPSRKSFHSLDADTAFEVIGKFAKEYLGKDYEALYAVHDNTNHIHGHIIFNSVSFRDGRKYRYKKGDWAREIQPVTNRLCEEYGLSTIEISEDRAKKSENYKDCKVLSFRPVCVLYPVTHFGKDG